MSRFRATSPHQYLAKLLGSLINFMRAYVGEAHHLRYFSGPPLELVYDFFADLFRHPFERAYD